MTNVFMLLGSLIILMMGFVAPLINLLFSLYQEGLKKLTLEYEADKQVQQETMSALGEKLKLKESVSDDGLTEIEDSITQLKKMKKKKIQRLSYLENKTVFRKLFVPLLVAFLLVLSSFFTSDLKVEIPSLILIFFILYYVASEFIEFLNVLQKVKGSTDDKESKELVRIGDLLEILNEKQEKLDIYLKAVQAGSDSIKDSLVHLPKLDDEFLEEVYVRFGGFDLKEDTIVPKLTLNEKATWAIAIRNADDRMAKDVEAGFRFPTDLVVDNTGPDSIYKDPKDGEQIVRYQAERIHAETIQLKSDLSITPIKKGKFSVRVFLKAENIKVKTVSLKFTVV